MNPCKLECGLSSSAKLRENTKKMFILWEFLASEGLQDDAREYLLEHEDEDIPFEITF